ncbi:uncharacterized protein CPUR_06435 [Claviceps purpurea 20.1]|uniref:Uncharacterized protein n=1 Tax=Claviceps purpurea (strain 20.1) TaxID=1111077 RepID=M1W9P7_CLAP2|nr:uncharacterized protein CPUR_06435 [Claviceps purpurea 20.1]
MSPYRISKIESTMADLIQSGHRLYAAKEDKAKNYKRALALFTSVSCHHGSTREHLKDTFVWILGNIAQLRKNDDFAWKMYTSGIEANQDTTANSSPKLLSRIKQLYDARKPLPSTDELRKPGRFCVFPSERCQLFGASRLRGDSIAMGFFNVPVDNLYAEPSVLRWIRDNAWSSRTLFLSTERCPKLKVIDVSATLVEEGAGV